jgi:hypothetical protein
MQGQGYGSFPQWAWRGYVLVDGWIHQSGFPRLLMAEGCDVLCHADASAVLARIFCEDPKMCQALRDAYRIPRYARDLDTLETLMNLLGISFDPFNADEKRVAPRLIVLERRRFQPESRPPVEPERPRPPPPPLSAKSSWVSIACVDDGKPARPVPGVALEVVTASAEVRTAYTKQDGMAYVDRIAPGRVSIRVLGRDGTTWRPLEGDAATPSRAPRTPTPPLSAAGLPSIYRTRAQRPS